MTTYKREAHALAHSLRELLNDLEDRSADHPHAVQALAIWEADEVSLRGLYGDPFTDAAALLLENEREITERADIATRRAVDAIAAGEADHTPDVIPLARVNLADELRELVEAENDVRGALEGIGGFAADFVRLALGHVDWLHLARCYIAEAELQRSDLRTQPAADPAHSTP